jgi:LPXTG-motif cell wall-anchored protein
MLQTLSGNRTKILAFTIAIAMILLYTMSFATTAFADSENSNRPDHSYSNNGQGQENNNGQGQENNNGQGQENNNGQGQENNNGQGQENNNGQGQENNNGQGQENNNGQGQDNNNGNNGSTEIVEDTTGTQVRYHINLSKDDLDNLEQVKLTITFEDENGDTVTDEVIMTKADYQGKHFIGFFAGTYRENSMTIVGYDAVITWTTAIDTTFEIDHQSNNGFGANSVINVFTKGVVAQENEDDTTGGDTNTDNTDNAGNTGSTGTSNTSGSTTNVNNSVTIEEDLVPESAALELVDDTEEMVQITIMEEEAVPLADVPQTGVAEDTALFILMMLASLAGIAVLARKRDTIME